MSDRTDPEVRKLAEEIAGTAHRQGISSFEIERKLATFQSQREAALQAQLHRALGEGARLREALERELVREDFDGFRCECGAEGVDEFDDLEHGSDCPLTASPLSERAGAVLEEAKTLGALASDPARQFLVTSDLNELILRLDALRAELQKGGEGG